MLCPLPHVFASYYLEWTRCASGRSKTSGPEPLFELCRFAACRWPRRALRLSFAGAMRSARVSKITTDRTSRLLRHGCWSGIDEMLFSLGAGRNLAGPLCVSPKWRKLRDNAFHQIAQKHAGRDAVPGHRRVRHDQFRHCGSPPRWRNYRCNRIRLSAGCFDHLRLRDGDPDR